MIDGRTVFSQPRDWHCSHRLHGSPAQRQGASAPLTIQKQGSFAVGGKILGDPNAQSLHCDHGYVDYQIPVNPRRVNLVMWHSAAATAWLNRWDGGEGFQSIFLRRGYPVYIWDGPHVGRANWGCTEHTTGRLPAGIRETSPHGGSACSTRIG
jgi:hypothetical protein